MKKKIFFILYITVLSTICVSCGKNTVAENAENEIGYYISTSGNENEYEIKKCEGIL